MEHRRQRTWRATLMGKWGVPEGEYFGDSVRQYVGAPVVGASVVGASVVGASVVGAPVDGVPVVGASVGGASVDALPNHQNTKARKHQNTDAPTHRRTETLAVHAILPGRENDGLIMRQGAQERSWGEHAEIMRRSLEAWRANPLARRLVALVTSTCVGDGIRLTSPYPPLEAFLRDFWAHPQNRIDDLLPEWSDELSRSGELFLALFPDPATGMSYVRAIPASQIEEVAWEEGDYRTELAYRDVGEGMGNVRWWKSPAHPNTSLEDAVVLHFAINRPVGAVRGESDLAPSLEWLERYDRWLFDRVRLNSSMRTFLWVVNAPESARSKLSERYRATPDPGTVILADEDEKWTAVTPSLHAADAEMDGRAIRWMIAAGGPGTALIDLGEGEDANLATGAVMQELKRRFLRRRQRVLVEMLKEVALTAFRRWAAVMGAPVRAVTAEEIVALAPDISPEDNAALAQAAGQMVQALASLQQITGESEEFRRMALRLFARFAGESLSAGEIERLLRRDP